MKKSQRCGRQSNHSTGTDKDDHSFFEFILSQFILPLGRLTMTYHRALAFEYLKKSLSGDLVEPKKKVKSKDLEGQISIF